MIAEKEGEDSFYNAADDLIERNLCAGRGEKIAFIDSNGQYTFNQVAEKASQFSNAIQKLGLKKESRLILVMLDSIEFVCCFLGAIKAGIIPVPLNTRLTPRDYSYIISDTDAAGLIISDSLADTVLQEAKIPSLVIVDGTSSKYRTLYPWINEFPTTFVSADTKPDDICFWLYTSGTTGLPKGVVHLHSHLLPTADLYAIPYLNISSDDVVFSAAKLFFAYGLGNALTFPMAVGATSVLLPGPPDPKSVVNIFTEFQPTLFFGVPTLFAMLLASELPEKSQHSIRLSVSAGEPLPADLLHRWTNKVGTKILDGIGTTEMLHIFVSNEIDDIQPGTTGRVVPGYEVRLINESGELCSIGEIGILEVSGPTSALMYWGQREKTKATFRGEWTRTGDNYTMGDNGVMTYGGRNDDMLKVGGIYVSPFEVEGALIKHPSVLEAAVIGYPDQDELIKPKAFIVLVDGLVPSEALAEELKNFVRSDLAAYKYPRWIEFSDALPKTATGKIQRFKLRNKA